MVLDSLQEQVFCETCLAWSYQCGRMGRYMVGRRGQSVGCPFCRLRYNGGVRRSSKQCGAQIMARCRLRVKMNGCSLMKTGGDHRLAYDSDEGRWGGSKGGQSIVRIKMYREDKGRGGIQRWAKRKWYWALNCPDAMTSFRQAKSQPSLPSAIPHDFLRLLDQHQMP